MYRRALAATALVPLLSGLSAPVVAHAGSAAVVPGAVAGTTVAGVAGAAARTRCSATAAGRLCIAPARVISSRTTKDRRGRLVRTVVTRQVRTLTTARTITTTTVTTTRTTVGRAKPVLLTRKVVRVTPIRSRLSDPVPNPTTPAAPKSPVTPSAPVIPNVDAEAWEQRVFDLTNTERVKAGLRPFLADSCASGTARAWSATMLRTHQYEHSSSWAPLQACAEAAGGNAGMAENIYSGNAGWHLTPEQAVRGWMASPGHRANILNAAYTRLGVGFAGSFSGKHYATQQFWG